MSVVTSEKNTTADVASLIEKSVALNPGVAAGRQEALEVFRKLGLPEKKSEEYKNTPITRYLRKRFRFDRLTDSSSTINPDEFLIPSVDGNIVVSSWGPLNFS